MSATRRAFLRTSACAGASLAFAGAIRSTAAMAFAEQLPEMAPYLTG